MKERNLNKSFKRFHENLQISDADKASLQEARRTIRSHLRQEFEEEFEEIKFMTQGSYAYHTLIRPNHTPPQQMDLDDGAYFFIDHNQIPGKLLLGEVDDVLKKLTDDREGWRLNTSKPTCSRVIISDDKHIDIPCYAIGNGQLHEEISLGEIRSTHRSNFASLYRDAGIPYYDLADSSSVQLAHREKDWITSDPRKIIDWVLECVKEYGSQFLRVCCYFKAWRDNQCPKSPMKSLLIMAMVERAFIDEEVAKNSIDDDEVTFRVAGRMKDYLEDKFIQDPSDGSKYLDENLSPEERDEIVKKLESLHEDMETVLYDNDVNGERAIELMREQFGKWFPKSPKWITSLAVAPSIISKQTEVRPERPWVK